MKDLIIKADNLKFAYSGSDSYALKGFDIEVERGTKVAFLGANGAGKSTFFLCLNGIHVPDSGTLYIDGKAVSYDKAGLKEMRRKVGIVFQDPDNQLFSASVYQEISFGPLNLGMSEAEADKAVREVMGRMGISGFSERPVHSLSGGQKKQVSIADIVVMDPEIIVLDEPASSLDPKHAAVVEKIIEDLTEGGVTVLVSTHDVDFALRWADRVAVVDDGRVLKYGEPEEIFSDEELLKRTNLRKPAVSEIYGELLNCGLAEDRDRRPRTVSGLKSLIGQREEGVSEEKEDYVVKNGERLRCGFTTGSCAAAASSAAAEMALTGLAVPAVSIRLPKGEEAAFTVNNPEISRGYARCSVTKDGGDDPDVTTGLEIFSEVRLTSEEGADKSGRVIVDGGSGVGRVTKPGLARKPGEAAINPVPLEMIEKNVRNVLDRHGFKGDAEVIISVPGGEETARKTFNPRLGIEGGISILGTTGIVEPMSEKALIDTVIAEINVHRARDGEKIIITPGNYGSDFIEGYLGLDIRKAVQCSNFIGETLDYLRYAGFGKILLAGHTGKLIKLASGIMNTHSSYADGRMEIIASHAAMSGASSETVRKIMDCITTDQALDLVKSEQFYENIKESVTEKVMEHLKFRLKDECEIEVVMFTSDRGHIMKSSGADRLIREFM